MAENEKIICPNCGATNKQYGKCEYCGSSIECKLSDFENGKVEIQGRYEVKFDNRVLIQKYDKFEDETITYCKYCDKYRFLVIKAYDENDVKYEKDFHLTFKHINNKRGNEFVFSFPGDKCTIHIDKRNYKIDYELSKKALCAICDAKSISIKVGYDYIVSEESVMVVIMLAQVYYNTFFDSSKYKDAADRLYNYFEEKERKQKQREEQIQEQMEDWKKKENFQSCLLALLILGGLMLFGLIFHLN